MRKIVISGATGNTGFPTVNELSKSQNVQIVALTRDKNGQKAKHLATLPNVEVMEADLSKPETLLEPLRGAQAAMIATPWNDLLENEINFINALIREEVEFLLKVSTTSTTMKEDSKVGYARKHLLIEKYLNESGKITWAGLRPNEFMENRLGFGQAVQHQDSFPSIQGENESAMISVDDIGKVASLILSSDNWEAFKGKSMVLSGPENVSDKKLAEILTAEMGKKINYDVLPEEELAKMFFGESVPNAIIEQMKEFNQNVKDGNHTKENLPTDKTILDLYTPSTTLKEVVQTNIELFE